MNAQMIKHDKISTKNLENKPINVHSKLTINKIFRGIENSKTHENCLALYHYAIEKTIKWWST